MHYDVNLIRQLCCEIGLSARVDPDKTRVEIDLGQGAVLFFLNAEREQDCRIGFSGTPWHMHDEYFDYLDVVVGLKEGRLLVRERFVHGRVVDRRLIHRDEFECIEEGEQIVVRRATTNAAGHGQDRV